MGITKVKQTAPLVDGTLILSTLRKKVKEQYGSLYKFANNPSVSAQLGYSPTAILDYLSRETMVSFPFAKKLCDYFGMGDLRKDVVVTRTIKYYYESNQSNGKGATKKSARSDKAKKS